MTTETQETRHADTLNIALAFTGQEETSALRSTVAWTVHIVSQVLGWNEAPLKGGVKVAVKMAREMHGYVPGQFDAKGNKKKRSAVFARLSLVQQLVNYAVKNEREWIETIHAAATNPEMEGEERDAAVISEIEQFADRLATLTKSETIDGLRYFLETGEAKADAPAVDNPAEALTDEQEPEQEPVAETDPMTVGQVIAWLQLGTTKAAMTYEQAQQIADLALDIAAMRREEVEEEKQAA